MGTSENVVKNYLRIIFDKIGAFNRVEAALWYLDNSPNPGTQRKP